ncbi:hypothetical protein QQ045_006750 [Rhodiola kirilowii]
MGIERRMILVRMVRCFRRRVKCSRKGLLSGNGDGEDFLNAIELAEKERIEKEKRIQTILDAEEYIQALYEKRKTNVESKKVQNREREKVYNTTREKFHKEADKQYWKAIAELVPNEVPNIEKRGSVCVWIWGM